MPPAECRPYQPRGTAIDLLYDRSSEVLMSGPAGTGKSRACLEKLHLCAEKYPGMRGLILRKTRASCTEAVLVTYEDKVLPGGHVARLGASRQMRQAYQYANGSTIVVGGLDKDTRVMSTEYDMAYVQEAIELDESDWETLTTRLRNGKMPYQQIIADTNPSSPQHWLKKRCDAGVTKILESRHEDNPTLWDGRKWTKGGAAYISKLDALTGPRLQRLRYGRWVQAEGVVYDGWDAARHLVDRFPIPKDWPRLLSIDFGYVHPFVCFDDQTEIMTPEGWRRFAELPRGRPVAAIDPVTRAVRWEVPTAYIDQPYEGPLIVSEPNEESADFAVTPNHRMLVESRKTGKWQLTRADQLPSGNSIPVGWVPCQDVPDEAFQVPRVADGHPNRRSLPPVSRIAFSRLVGLIVAEGCLSKSGRYGTSKYIRIAQSKNVEAVRTILAATGWRWSECEGRNGVIDFAIGNADLYDLLAAAGCEQASHEKSIPAFLFDWGKSCLEALLDGLIVGDGSPRRFDAEGRVVSSMAYHTTSRRLADDVQHLACLLGLPTVIHEYKRSGGYANAATETAFKVQFHRSRRAAVEGLKLEQRPYSGRVYCVTVPSGLIVVRRNGRPMICGNCQWWAIDPDGRMYRYREIYHTKRLVEDHARQIVELSAGEPTPVCVICDHDAEDRATLERHMELPTIPARKEVMAGIQAVAERLQGINGRPRLLFLRDSLVERDAELHEGKKPCCTEEEMDAYVWDERAGPKGDRPIKDNDHGMDCCRYAVATYDLEERGEDDETPSVVRAR